jgi:hypothetical protein
MMLDKIFVPAVSFGMRVAVAISLLGYACSDDAHGTNYFMPALGQYLFYSMKSVNGFIPMAVA